MAIHTYTWEHPLLAKAYEAYEARDNALNARPFIADSYALQDAYEYCKLLTKANSHTFYLASSLLPQDRRRAIHALYAFCRATDDIVDKSISQQDATSQLDVWRSRLSLHPNMHDPIPMAWIHTQTHYDIPYGYVTQLIDGIARDLTQKRYHTFGELAEYCYSVASTVGLMVMYIIRFKGEEALPYAIKLGVALQLTNILRDVGEDWRAGRLYLPLEELNEFGLTEADIEKGRVDDRWRKFMAYQIERTRKLYKEAEPGIGMLHSEGRFAITAATGLYQAILEDIEKHDYDVFNRRAHIGVWGKLSRLPNIWWKARTIE
jgi:phytoene synthase